MIEVPGAGRVPVGHRSGLMGRGDYRPGIHEYGKSASFSPGERRIAESLHRRHPGEAFHAWADDRGKSKLKNPDCIRRPNPESPGIPVEFKTLESATSNAVHQRIRSAAQQIEDHGGGEVVIDGRDAGLTLSVAEAGCAKFLRNARHHQSYIPTKITIILPDDDHYEPIELAMATSDQIMFGTLATVEDLASRIASALQMTLERSERAGFLYVHRPAKATPSSTVSGTFNSSQDEAGPDEPSVIDGYPVDLDIYLLPQDDDVLHSETRILFDDLTRVIDVPMIYLRNFDHLVAAFQPGVGVSELPKGVTAYGDSEAMWRPFALNRTQLY